MTIFGRIIAGELPAEKVFENDHIIAFKDINPLAPIHFLIMPKKEIKNIQSLAPEDYPLISDIIAIAQQLARDYQIEDGYRLLTNNGSSAGQSVFHLHFHLIGGALLGPVA